jgi:hypothetical protein
MMHQLATAASNCRSGEENMSAHDSEISRISKLLIDRDQLDPDVILKRRQAHAVTLSCGDDVATSYTLQLAVLTAATTATRCFPGAVHIAISPRLADAPLLIWPWLRLTFGQAVHRILGPVALQSGGSTPSRFLVFGDGPVKRGALRVTFDGWIAKVGPVELVGRLQEREYFSGSGVLAAALALSEVFLSFAEVSLHATRRAVGLSLWRPDLDTDNPESVGIPVEFIPKSVWILGLGHLGNAYLWTLATLPYTDPKSAEFALLDFDKVVKYNIETGVLFANTSINRFKAHACDQWLAEHGFDQTRVVERRFDTKFDLQEGEPRLAFCGFDTNPARRDLDGKFPRVFESGLGGTLNNYDTISFHSLPNPRTTIQLWPDLSDAERKKIEAEQERAAAANAGYQKLRDDICGRRELAGKSVAVPFVGLTAASIVLAEAVRLAHDGPAYHDLRISLGTPSKRNIQRNGNYTVRDTTGLEFIRATRLA